MWPFHLLPWAGKHSRFTLLFEAFAIEVLKASASVKAAAALLDIDWQTAHAIMQRAVERGLQRRTTEGVKHVGIDEKSFGHGHDYVSLMTDLDASRVLEVVEDGQFFADWDGWAVRSRLKPIAAKAKMRKRHLNELLSYFRQPITNATSEGFNSRIQAIKSAARGFRAFDNYRTRILFYCGKLDLVPEGASH
jgi:transposase